MEILNAYNKEIFCKKKGEGCFEISSLKFKLKESFFKKK